MARRKTMYSHMDVFRMFWRFGQRCAPVIVGVTVKFTLPELLSGSLFAGGIGLPPFLSMFSDVGRISEPGMLLRFIAKVAENLVVRIFSAEPVAKAENVTVHQGGITFAYLVDSWEDWVGLCVGRCRTLKTFPCAHS